MIDGYPVIGPLKNQSGKILCNFGHYRHGILLSLLARKLLLIIFVRIIKKDYKFFSPQRFNL